jgi:hypothetical protein
VAALPGRPFGGLQQSLKILNLEFAIAKNLVQQSGAGRLTRMRRHHAGPPILVTEEVVAAFDSHHHKACLGQCCKQFRAGNSGNPAHAGIVMR